MLQKDFLGQYSNEKSEKIAAENPFTYGHNPLINPTPFNIQNPYLRKEYQKYLGQNSNK